ncbi:MAG TPA: heme lyase CcmF/NrfE family subunit [Acidimicrobiales bacterium]|nr:heme lyase CcmF/NrfE family subunit [Acidimicrobiales bacterium]
MNAALGESAELLAFGAAIIGLISLALGLTRRRPSLVRAGHTYVWVILAGAVLATVAMQHALLTNDFRLQYVVDNDSTQTPILFRITAMWSNLAGSILLWGLVLAGWTTAVAVRFRKRRDDPLIGWAIAVCYAVAAFFFGLMLTASNPFTATKGPIPTQGAGVDPLLQNHILVAFHPPILYTGLVGFTVPFAFACASLITGRLGEGWLLETRRWTLFSWAFLTVGVILGAWWSYEVLSWGGYWAWDPVENAAFLPWLTGTAYLHSVMVQERRGMLRVWNLALLLSTFSLTILATFLTRSGVLNSVHSFDNTGIGPALLSFFGVIVAGCIGLLAWRGDQLRSPGSIASPLSREAAFLVNNLLFGAFTLIVLLGTVFPLIVQAVNGSQITVGAPYFDRMTMPVVVCLLFLMAVAPVLPWRQTTPGLLRTRLYWPAAAAVVTLVACVIAGLRGLNPLLAFGLGAFAGASALRQLVLEVRRRGWTGFSGPSGGGMIVHLGVVVIAVAFAASHSFAHRQTLQINQGQTVAFDGHHFTYLGIQNVSYSTHISEKALVRIDGGQAYAPALSSYYGTGGSGETVPTPSVKSSLRDDIYLTFDSQPAKPGGSVSIGVIIEPLVNWIWLGGGVIAFGTFLSAWPDRRRRRPVERPAGEDTAETVPAEVVGAS